jgi:hypothetical protein
MRASALPPVEMLRSHFTLLQREMGAAVVC